MMIHWPAQSKYGSDWRMEPLTLTELSLLAMNPPPRAAGLDTVSRSLACGAGTPPPPCTEGDWMWVGGHFNHQDLLGWTGAPSMCILFILECTSSHGSSPNRAKHQGVHNTCWLSWEGSLLIFHFVADSLAPQTWCSVVLQKSSTWK